MDEHPKITYGKETAFLLKRYNIQRYGASAFFALGTLFDERESVESNMRSAIAYVLTDNIIKKERSVNRAN